MNEGIRNRILKILRLSPGTSYEIYSRGVSRGWNWALDPVCMAVRSLERDGKIKKNALAEYIVALPKRKDPPLFTRRKKMPKKISTEQKGDTMRKQDQEEYDAFLKAIEESGPVEVENLKEKIDAIKALAGWVKDIQGNRFVGDLLTGAAGDLERLAKNG